MFVNSVGEAFYGVTLFGLMFIVYFVFVALGFGLL